MIQSRVYRFASDALDHGGGWARDKTCSGLVAINVVRQKIKMMLFRVADADRYGWLFSLGLLLLAAANVPIINGQQGIDAAIKLCVDSLG